MPTAAQKSIEELLRDATPGPFSRENETGIYGLNDRASVAVCTIGQRVSHDGARTNAELIVRLLRFAHAGGLNNLWLATLANEAQEDKLDAALVLLNPASDTAAKEGEA